MAHKHIIREGIEDGSEFGDEVLGIPGKLVGGALGGAVMGTASLLGLVAGVAEAAFDSFTS